MSKTLTAQERDQLPKGPDDEFYCRLRKRRLTLQKCLDDYVNANALNEKNGACWQCEQGSRNREAYSTA